MNRKPYNLRHRTTQQKNNSSGEEFFDSGDINMAEMENVLEQMRALQREVNTLRETQGVPNDGTRANLQRVHIPKFNKHNPQLWFAQIERSFALCDVTSDSDKFDLVSVRLEDEILLLTTNFPHLRPV